MNLALWIFQGLLSAVFLASGSFKLFFPKEKIQSAFQWTNDVPFGMVRTVGLLDLLGAVGIVLPMALNVMPVLSAWAALGLAALMVGATFTNLKYKEVSYALGNLVILGLATVVFLFRSGVLT